jgi:hypothetical protein
MIAAGAAAMLWPKTTVTGCPGGSSGASVAAMSVERRRGVVLRAHAAMPRMSPCRSWRHAAPRSSAARATARFLALGRDDPVSIA